MGQQELNPGRQDNIGNHDTEYPGQTKAPHFMNFPDDPQQYIGITGLTAEGVEKEFVFIDEDYIITEQPASLTFDLSSPIDHRAAVDIAVHLKLDFEVDVRFGPVIDLEKSRNGKQVVTKEGNATGIYFEKDRRGKLTRLDLIMKSPYFGSCGGILHDEGYEERFDEYAERVQSTILPPQPEEGLSSSTQRLLAETNEAYEVLKRDPDAWQEELDERKVWDVTLLDDINVEQAEGGAMTIEQAIAGLETEADREDALKYYELARKNGASEEDAVAFAITANAFRRSERPSLESAQRIYDTLMETYKLMSDKSYKENEEEPPIP